MRTFIAALEVLPVFLWRSIKKFKKQLRSARIREWVRRYRDL